MKQLTATHHRNYLEVEHKSTGRCTPFAPCHPKEKSKAGPVHAWTIQWWIQRTTITGNNWIKVNYIWEHFPAISGPFQRYIHKVCTGDDQNNRSARLEFRFLEVNIRLRIEEDNICLFQVLMQLYSAPYNFLHSRCLYKVSSFTWHVNADRNR